MSTRADVFTTSIQEGGADDFVVVELAGVEVFRQPFHGWEDKSEAVEDAIQAVARRLKTALANSEERWT